MAQSLKGPPYKDPLNKFLTASLFKGVATIPVCEPIFHLYNDVQGLINARTSFVHLGDPTGYKWCMLYLGDYQHWNVLMKCKWFVEAYNVWLNELKVKMKSEALDKVREIAEGDGAQALAAAKFLTEVAIDKHSRGRPTKAEVQGELKRATQMATIEDEDMQRIGLKLVVNNGNGS